MKQLTVTWIRDVFAIGLGEFLVYVYLWARCKKTVSCGRLCRNFVKTNPVIRLDTKNHFGQNCNLNLSTFHLE